MLRPLIACLVLLVQAPCFGQAPPDPRVARAERIAHALGLPEAMKSVQDLQVESARHQVAMVVQQMQKEGRPERMLVQAVALGEDMAGNVARAWDPKEAARIYADGLVEAMSDTELERAELYYSSPEGRKAYAAIEASMRRMMDYITARTDAVMQAETARFVERLKPVAGRSVPAGRP